MRILITNVWLQARAGTETVVRDLALALARSGRQPAVFTPRPGAVAAEIAAAGVPVVTDPRDLPWTPDVIHGHHHVETVRSLLAFPDTPAIYILHDRRSWCDVPPLFPRITHYVAVDLRDPRRPPGRPRHRRYSGGAPRHAASRRGHHLIGLP